MKTLKLIPLCLAIVMLALVSCEKDAPAIEKNTIETESNNIDLRLSPVGPIIINDEEDKGVEVEVVEIIPTFEPADIEWELGMTSLAYAFSNNILKVVIETNENFNAKKIGLMNMNTGEIQYRIITPDDYWGAIRPTFDVDEFERIEQDDENDDATVIEYGLILAY